MALINTGPNYTRSGDNFLTRWANRISMLPFGGVLSWPLGQLGTFVEAAGWLFRGKVFSAATVLAAGTVSNSINAAVSSNPVNWFIGYGAQLGSGAVSGSTLGTHGRAATEAVIGAVTGAFGARPTILRSYTAGVGSIGGQSPSGPGYYATRAAQERGQDPNAMWNNYRNGGGAEHVAALEASRANGPSYRSV